MHRRAALPSPPGAPQVLACVQQALALLAKYGQAKQGFLKGLLRSGSDTTAVKFKVRFTLRYMLPLD